MIPRRVIAAVCGSIALATASVGAASEADTPAGPGIVFSVWKALPPDGACPGLYSVDAQTREISWLGGYDAGRNDFANYPMFTARRSLSFGHIAGTSSGTPTVEIHAGTRVVARASWIDWAWSPRREEVAFPRFAKGGRRLELVLASVTGATRVLAPSIGFGLSWLPDGSGVVYGRLAGTTSVITFVRRDGRDRVVLARDASFPLVSPDGRRVAFLRARSRLSRAELWVVPTRGGAARKVFGPAPAQELRPAVWLSSRELLVQHGGRHDSIFDVGDTLTRVDVDSGRERAFLKRGFALSVSPDRSRVLFVRPHRSGETYYSIRTVRSDGSDEQLLAVTDEEDLNIRSWPVWKPAGVRLGWIGDPAPAGSPTEDACVARVASLRARTP